MAMLTYDEIESQTAVSCTTIRRYLPVIVAKPENSLPSEMRAKCKAYSNTRCNGMTDEKLERLKVYQREKSPKSKSDCALLLEVLEHIVNKYCKRHNV